MRLIILSSQLLALLITTLECDARSTRVTAQYTVADGGDNNAQRTFRGKGIVEDASVVEDGIVTKFGVRPTRSSSRGQPQQRKKTTPAPSPDFDVGNYPQEQLSFKPDIFALKGKVFDDKSVPTRGSHRVRPTQQNKQLSQYSLQQQSPSAKVQPVPVSQFRFPSIKNEEIFESKPLDTRNVKPEELESTYSYSTIKFSGGDEESDESKVFTKKLKGKPPKRSASPTGSSSPSHFNLEQTFGGQLQQSKFTTAVDHGDSSFDSEGFKPSTQFALQTSTTKRQKQNPPKKLFTSPEDEFKDAEFFDFSIRPRPSQATPPKFEKFSSDLGVKALAIKPHKNKFDPPHLQNGGFKPSPNTFKLKDIPNIHGSDIGHGIASPGQLKTFFDAAESERDERYKLKLQSDPSPASKAQLAQFLRAKEDEQLERLVEQQFKLQQQKQIAQEKEVELKHQRFLLQRQKEKLKQVEKSLHDKVNRQNTRPKRRPSSPVITSSRRQRNPSPVNFSVHGGGKSSIPVRTLKSNNGSYRVSFNI